jgi:uncharacterized membrane protein (UPF0127 family)
MWKRDAQMDAPCAKFGEVYHARRMRLSTFVAMIAVACGTITAACDGSDYGNSSEPTPTVAVATAAVSPTIALSESGLPVIEVSYGDGVLLVEVANTPESRRLGLGGRESLGDDAGMLFDLGETRVPSFSMRATLIPLDFIWITEDMRVQGIVADVQPTPPDQPLASYSPTEPVRYVLEVNAGTAERLGITPGDHLEFAPP